MLQQIIASDPTVASKPEPWFMLPLAYLLKEKTPGVKANYNYHYLKLNFNSFLSDIDSDKVVLKKAIRDFAQELYSQASTSDRDTIYFLDKTPRYYHIIGELLSIFPSCKIVLLSRNPLHVFASILQYNFNGNILGLATSDRVDDLFTAPQEILKYKDHPRTWLINYEQLVEQPEQIVRPLMDFLQLSIDESNIKGRYQVKKEFRESTFIDTKAAIKHNKPEKKYLESWKENINDRQKKKLAKAYIQMLGKNVYHSLGYSIENTLRDLENHKVSFCIPTISLRRLMSRSNSRLKSLLIKLYSVQTKNNL